MNNKENHEHNFVYIKTIGASLHFNHADVFECICGERIIRPIGWRPKHLEREE